MSNMGYTLPEKPYQNKEKLINWFSLPKLDVIIEIDRFLPEKTF